MARQTFNRLPALAMAALLALLAPLPLAAQDWFSQHHVVFGTVEADSETLEHPAGQRLAMLLPVDVAAADVCVAHSGSREGDRGRTRVEVVVSRPQQAGAAVEIQRLQFEWHESDPPLLARRCQPAVPLFAGDLIEFDFRFFDMPRLETFRRGKQIQTLPILEIEGRVRHDPTEG